MKGVARDTGRIRLVLLGFTVIGVALISLACAPDLTSDVQALRGELEGVTNQAKELTAQNQTLRGELKSVTSEAKDLAAQVKALEAKVVTGYEPVTREIWMITRMVMPMMMDAEFAPGKPISEGMPKPPMQHRFDPGIIVVNKGDTVELHVLVLDNEWHEINIGAFTISEVVNPGEDILITFVADQAGVFEILCSNHDTREHHGPMVASFIVNDVS